MKIVEVLVITLVFALAAVAYDRMGAILAVHAQAQPKSTVLYPEISKDADPGGQPFEYH